jgi:hypothetical protein
MWPFQSFTWANHPAKNLKFARQNHGFQGKI